MRTFSRQIIGPALLLSLASLASSHTAQSQTTAPRASAPAVGTGLGRASSAPATRSAAPTSRPVGPRSSYGPASPGTTRTYGRSQAYGGSQSLDVPPRPSIELPRNPHPTFEVPSYNNVQPYPGRGDAHRFAYQPYGDANGAYYPGYAYPGYADPGYIDGSPDLGAVSSSTTDSQTGTDQQQRRPSYTGSGDAAAQTNGAQTNTGDASQPYPYPSGPAPGGPYESHASTPKPSTGPVTDGLDHPEVTLVFNDGRAPEKVRNYAITRTTLFVMDSTRQRQIPLTALNLPATIEQNRTAGVEFTVPGQTK